MNQKHHMHMQISCSMASSTQILGIGLFSWLSPHCCLYLRCSDPGAKPKSGKIVLIPSKGFKCIFHTNVPRKSPLHTYGRPCMHEVHGRQTVPTHSGYVCYPHLGMTPFTKVFVCSKHSPPISAWEIDWHRLTSGLSFFCCIALGSFHKLFPSHPERHARPNHVQQTCKITRPHSFLLFY